MRSALQVLGQEEFCFVFSQFRRFGGVHLLVRSIEVKPGAHPSRRLSDRGARRVAGIHVSRHVSLTCRRPRQAPLSAGERGARLGAVRIAGRTGRSERSSNSWGRLTQRPEIRPRSVVLGPRGSEVTRSRRRAALVKTLQEHGSGHAVVTARRNAPAAVYDLPGGGSRRAARTLASSERERSAGSFAAVALRRIAGVSR